MPSLSLCKDTLICFQAEYAPIAEDLKYILRKQTPKRFSVYACPLASAFANLMGTEVPAGNEAVVAFIGQGPQYQTVFDSARRLLGTRFRLVQILVTNDVNMVITADDKILVPQSGGPDVMRACACELKNMLGCGYELIEDGLPIGYPFDYEKEIIDAYIDGTSASPHRRGAGCPAAWPRVEIMEGLPEMGRNPLKEEAVGEYRDENANVVVDTRTRFGNRIQNLTFREAGPRERLRYRLGNANMLRVGILVSGGIAPGINAAIDGIVSRHARRGTQPVH